MGRPVHAIHPSSQDIASSTVRMPLKMNYWLIQVLTKNKNQTDKQEKLVPQTKNTSIKCHHHFIPDNLSPQCVEV